MDSQIHVSHMRCLTNLGAQVLVAAVVVLKSFLLNLGSAMNQQVAWSCRLCPCLFILVQALGCDMNIYNVNDETRLKVITGTASTHPTLY